jgi:hypothetical protein
MPRMVKGGARNPRNRRGGRGCCSRTAGTKKRELGVSTGALEETMTGAVCRKGRKRIFASA